MPQICGGALFPGVVTLKMSTWHWVFSTDLIPPIVITPVVVASYTMKFKEIMKTNYGVIKGLCIPSKIPEWYQTSKDVFCNFKFLHVSGWLMTKVLKSSLSWQICSEQGQTRSRHSPAFMVPGDTI